MRLISYLTALIFSLMLVACGGGGGSAGVPSGATTALTTTASSNLAMVFGNTQSFSVSGGKEPYVATSSNSSIAKAAMSGAQLTITSVMPGAVTVDIRDATGKVVSVSLTVTDGSSSTTFFTSAPNTLNLLAGTAQSFTVSGGLAPYMVNSTDSSVAVAGINGGQLNIAALKVGTSTIGLLDSAGRTLSISVVVTNGASATPLFTTAPTSVTVTNGGSRTYAISGGLAPYSATSSDASIASSSVIGSTLTVIGLQGGTTSVQVRDAAGTLVTFSVKVGSSNNFFTTAPSTLTVAAGSSASFAVSGGSQSYLASSSDASIATASVGGGTLTITGVATRTSNIKVSDTTGATSSIVVTVVGGVAVSVARVDVTTSTNTLQSAGSEATITAIVKNAGNVGLAGQNIVFSSSSGSLQSPSAQTDATGSATVKLTAGTDKTVRNITVSASVGTVSGSVVVPVTGTRLSIAGSGTLQAGGAATPYTVRALDSSSNPVAGASLAITSALGNAVSPATVVTDASGSATFTYTPTLPTPSGQPDTLTTRGLGTSATASVVVTSVSFVVKSPAANYTIPIDTQQAITVEYRELGLAQANKVVNFSTTRGTLAPLPANITTNVSGQATINISSTTAGPAEVVAQIAGVGSVSLPVQFVATVPATVAVQSNPGAVQPNVTGTTNQSTIEAVVRDLNGNPVANRQVNFTTLQDLSNGTLSTGNAMTDANGRAQVQFIPGASSTPANGVVIQAEVASTAIRSTTTLTVNGNALFITIGFGNDIGNLDPTTYSKSFSVYVTDANGVAVGNQLITIAVIPTQYFKGTLTLVNKFWEYSGGFPTATCANEDLNFDGILNAGEDINANGQLTPGNIVVAAPGSVTTDATGHALFALQYGEQYAPWATVQITARAVVSGTESRKSISFSLAGLIDDFKDPNIPAGRISPFGSSTLCTDAL
ncbi:MAG: Ig-like protein group 1 [Comamonadaceae bacterium]|nr:MAG: Ig-like protein group 1 [Comamonadaceae bacterium]